MSDRCRWICFILLIVTALAKGKSYSLPYKATDACLDNRVEYLVDETRCCSKCRPGTRLLNKCTSKTDTMCEPCPDGLFSENFNYYPNCFLCDKCPEEKGLQYEKQCTKDSNAVCVCKPGWYCIFGEPDSCSACERHRTCGPGKGAKSPGTSTEDVRCINCPTGTFSNETSSEQCQPHTQCDLDGRSTLTPGTSKTDTVCGPLIILIPSVARSRSVPTTSMPGSSSRQPAFSSKRPASSAFSTMSSILDPLSISTHSSTMSTHLPADIGLWIGLPVAASLVVLLILTLCICHRKGKPAVHAATEAGPCCKSHIVNPVENHGLLVDSDPSTASSSDSHSQGTGVSQDCLHIEHSSVSSPILNLSFTATINCQVNPAMGACSIPISPCVHMPEPEFPLSQEEELCVSCEQEDSKDAIQSVQESEMTKY